jgi:hypothetical protein
MNHADDWVEIVPPMMQKDAECCYKKWKEDRRKQGRDIDEDKVRIDHLLGSDGFTEVRYCLLRSEL